MAGNAILTTVASSAAISEPSTRRHSLRGKVVSEVSPPGPLWAIHEGGGGPLPYWRELIPRCSRIEIRDSENGPRCIILAPVTRSSCGAEAASGAFTTVSRSARQGRVRGGSCCFPGGGGAMMVVPRRVGGIGRGCPGGAGAEGLSDYGF